LILDDSGHRKSGNFTSVVGRQYIGEIGKTVMVIVTVITHYYDKKKFPIEIKFYQHSSSLAKGKDDELFEKKPDIGIELIDRSLSRGLSPGIVLIDGSYGNNTTF
jgi:SRSO17 transposase